MAERRLMEVGEAARRLKRSKGWARYLSDVGRLRAIRTGSGQRLFHEAEIERYLREREK